MMQMQSAETDTPNMAQAMRAYATSSSHRNLREQEADVFRRANAGLRHPHRVGSQGWVRALADNTRLWTTVLDLVCDPDNRLPAELRASIVSVGMAVQREMRRETPNFSFLIAVNENISDGLCGQG
jgi:flagellar biosynthesis regulator FlaF